MTKSYYRIMLGRKSAYAEECFAGGFIGADFGIKVSLADRLSDDLRQFKGDLIPMYLAGHPDKSRIAAGLACGALWTVAKGMQKGDVVLSPDGTGRYRVGEVAADYSFNRDGILPHRRNVRWSDVWIDRAAMSEPLRHSAGSIATISEISEHAQELERLIGGALIVSTAPVAAASGDRVQFELESHLQEFLVRNWKHTALGKDYELLPEGSGWSGREVTVERGRIDLLCVSNDKKTLLVIELKRGRASDVVVGQILRYMGCVKEEIAEPDQTVRGLIIALEDDVRIRQALTMTQNIEFMRYEVEFRLVRGT